jgi:diguanylate cyclase (GGDEF)-like protein
MPLIPHLRDVVGTCLAGLSRRARKFGDGDFWCDLEKLAWRTRAHDSLTGVLNRAEFHRRIEARWHKSPNAAVLLFDVDRLANTNYAVGHTAVDACLVAMARLVTNDAEGAWVCRWSGGEFAVFVTDASRAERVADRIRASMAQSFLRERASVIAEFPELAGQPVLTFSVGGAKVIPSSTLAQVLGRCEEAVLAAKVAGRNRFCWAH